MSDEADALYRDLASGASAEEPPARHLRALRDRVLAILRDGDENERLGALRVCDALPADRRIALLASFARDPSSVLRREALVRALGEGDTGLPLLRAVAEGDDPELAAEASRRLVQAVDRLSVPLMRRLAGSSDARVRAAAIELLGAAGGAGVRPVVSRALQDADAAVRDVAREALDRLEGTLPRPEPAPWWEEPLGSHLDPLALPAPAPQANVPPPPPALALVRRNEEPDEVAEPFPTSPLPAALPDAPGALLKLLGMVAEHDAEPVLQALATQDAVTMVQELRRVRPGRDPALQRGLARYVGIAGHPTWLRRLVPLFEDPDPAVRAAVAEAFGLQGRTGSLPRLQALLSDADPRVRAAAARAADAVGRRSGQQAVVDRWLSALSDDPDPAVRRAVGRR